MAKYLDLKPFRLENDDNREYDLIRAVAIYKIVRDHPNKSKDAIAGTKLLYNCFL